LSQSVCLKRLKQPRDMLDMLRRGTQDTNKEFSPADIDVPQTIGVAELEDTL